MKMKITEQENSVKIKVGGSFSSLSEINELVSTVEKRIKELEENELVLDFSSCKTLPSSIMGFLIHWDKELKNKNKCLILNNVPEIFMDLLKVCNLDSVLNIKIEKEE
ncbi:MAG: STAS domain-containing protein [bacterium]